MRLLAKYHGSMKQKIILVFFNLFSISIEMKYLKCPVVNGLPSGKRYLKGGVKTLNSSGKA